MMIFLLHLRKVKSLFKVTQLVNGRYWLWSQLLEPLYYAAFQVEAVAEPGEIGQPLEQFWLSL